MLCKICKKQVVDCTCPDIEERLKELGKTNRGIPAVQQNLVARENKNKRKRVKMDIKEIKTSLMNQFIESADEEQLRYLKQYFSEKIGDYEKHQVRVKERLKEMLKEEMEARGG